MSDDRFDDAWIFLSIGDAGGCVGPVGRNDMASRADANNHAIPTSAQLSRAIEALSTAGLAVAADDDVALTEEGCAAYQAANALGLGQIDRMFALAETWKRQFPPVSRPRT